MAIRFTREPLNGKYLCIHNPVVFEFSSDTEETEAIVSIVGSDLLKPVPIGLDGTFFYPAEEALRSFWDYNYLDANTSLEDSADSFLDNNLSQEITLRFTVGTDVAEKQYVLFNSAKSIGDSVFSGNYFALKVSNNVPFVANNYQEIAVYSDATRTVGGVNLVKGVNRVRLKTASEAQKIKSSFNIDTYAYGATGLRVKYFSRSGAWVYLKSECAGSEVFNVSTGQIIAVTRTSIFEEQTKFKELGKTAGYTYRLVFDNILLVYLKDLLVSPAVFIELHGKWIQFQVITPQVTLDITDTSATFVIDFRSSNLDVLIQN